MAAILELVKIVCSGPKFFGDYQICPKEVNILLSIKFGTCIRKGNTFPLDRLFCEAQYVTSPETSQYVTSPETLFNGSVKTMLYIKSPSSILYCIRLLGENIASQGYWISEFEFDHFHYGWLVSVTSLHLVI